MTTLTKMRLSATRALLERRDAIIVASVSAIYGLGDPESYLKMLLHIVVGDVVDRTAMIKRLVELQYERNELDFGRGTYRLRGEVLDIYPAESEQLAVRISMFDDEVEKITWFDPLLRQKRQIRATHYHLSKIALRYATRKN